MADVHSKEIRSYNMSRIKSRDTKPEMLVRRFLHSKGFRYRLHVKNLPGKPDIVLPKYKKVIEVHGCYFHRHKNCKFCTTPAKSANTDWDKKFQGTINRDKKNKELLKKMGWKTITIWECELKPPSIIKSLAKLPGKIIS